MKLISWNVNGIRACIKKGFEDFLNEADADIFSIQETKMQEGQVEIDFPDIINTGIAPRGRVIRAPLASLKRNRLHSLKD